MPRNGVGTFTLLTPIEIGALRSSAVVNADFTDMGTELTNSLPIDGTAGMTEWFRADAGELTAPGVSFVVDQDTGLRRSGVDTIAWVGGGEDRLTIDANGLLTLNNGLDVTGSVNLSSLLAPQTLVANAQTPLTMRREENDTTEREIVSYESGSGAGAKGSLRIVGDGSNAVATVRYYVNNVKAFEWTSALFTAGIDLRVGAAGIAVDASGYFDFPEISAPTSPAANVGRFYSRDSSGTTDIFYKSSAGTESRLIVATDRQTFTSSGTWTRPTTGNVAVIEGWGAGASGAGDAGTNGAGGGGGGAYSRKVIALASLSASVSVTIGAGGASVIGGDAAGLNGGTSTFGAYLSAFGGGGGGAFSGDLASGGGGGGASSTGGAAIGGNSGQGGDPLALLGANTFGRWDSSPFGGGGGTFGAVSIANTGLYGGGGGGGEPEDGGASIFGGGGGAGNGGAQVGGTSIFGGAGGATNTAGAAPAGGGGGGRNTFSGAGARGEIRITVW